MKDVTLFIGNDINNLTTGISWRDLLDQIIAYYKLTDTVFQHDRKPFPLLYEEIFLNVNRRDNRMAEKKVKEYIASKISEITPNGIHHRIREMGVKNIITTNYDYTLEGEKNPKNEGVIAERLYSIFRKTIVGKTHYWHVHGEADVPMSINLGYEHYGGQLQQLRNYVVSGTSYENKTIHKKSLVRRIKEDGLRALDFQSWADLFFSKDIHIFGIGLDFIEIDLWWILTFRARQKLYSGTIKIPNSIYYYTPSRYLIDASYKIQLLKANDIVVVDLPYESKENYYNLVLDGIEQVRL
jgi:hypothetical protein